MRTIASARRCDAAHGPRRTRPAVALSSSPGMGQARGMQARLALALGLLVLGASTALEVVVRGFGFPDGHATALERAYAARWLLARVPAVLLGLALVALAIRGRRDRAARLGPWLIAAAIVLAGLLAAWGWSVVELGARLDDGQGG